MKNFLVLGFTAMLGFVSFQSRSQSSIKEVAGEYYLDGVMEMGSGIKLNEDSTFLFFFSYGALDKNGSGTYTISGNKIILNSRPRPASDFTIIESKRNGKKGIQIKITDQNPMFVDEVNCRVAAAGQQEIVETNDMGEAAFNIKSADSIFIYHPIFSDRISVVVPKNKTDNYFEFKIDSCIMEIFCDNLVLEMKDGKLVGHHPMLNPEKDYEFVKQN